MKFYLCSPTAMAKDMESFRLAIESCGHAVMSRWHSGNIGNPRLELTDPQIFQRAVDDIRDIENSDVLIAFAASGGRGGRHYEMGYAYGAGLTVWMVGQMEHAFHSLHYNSGTQFDSWTECLKRIETLPPHQRIKKNPGYLHSSPKTQI